MTPTDKPSVDPPIVGPAVPAAPSFAVDTANGRFFPEFSGTGALPNATITISVVPADTTGAEPLVTQTNTVAAAADGSWSASITEISAGTHRATVTQTAAGVTSQPSAAYIVELVAPTIVSPLVGAAIPLYTDVALDVTGEADAQIGVNFSTTKLLEMPTVTERQIQLDSAGTASTTFAYLLRPYWETGVLTVRYTDGVRMGPAVSVALVRAP